MRLDRTKAVAIAIVCACGGDDGTQAAESTSATAGATTKGDQPGTMGSASGATTQPSTSTATSTAAESSTDAPTGSTGGTASGTTDTGRPACAKNVVLTGYWPPTNEMLRRWSTNAAQNPDGWVGENWGGYGYDVYAFFPEFPPDGDPTNDEIGEDGAVGSPDFDLRVDYQATSADFWRIVDTYRPVMLVTTSRGGDIGWEIEAIDGGHGVGNDGGPASDWTPDGYGEQGRPTKASIDERSWAAISEFRQGNTLPSTLPIDDIVAATSRLDVTNVVVDQETSGNFLSGFMGLHGVYHASTTPHVVAAGHIHVGLELPVADAEVMIDATLHALLQSRPIESVDCPAP